MRTVVLCKLAIMPLLLLSVILSGCAALDPRFEEPIVKLTGFQLVNDRGAPPLQFQIDLQVSNPNAKPLALRGIVYSVAIDGHQLISGVSNELPVIAGYGEGSVRVLATPDLMGGLGLLSDFTQRQRDSFEYQLRVKLDVGLLLPAVVIEKTGRLSFSRATGAMVF